MFVMTNKSLTDRSEGFFVQISVPQTTKINLTITPHNDIIVKEKSFSPPPALIRRGNSDLILKYVFSKLFKP